jgi:isocitrate dehydrogenase
MTSAYLQSESYPSTAAQSTLTPVAIAYGDGIGPEIMEATLRILEAAGARIACEPVEIGEAVYHRGFSSGIEPKAWDTLRRTRVFLKAPITTPQGGGVKSLNVTIRKTLGLYANVRPCSAYAPFVKTQHPRMDLVVVRENEEDLYAGIEHRQSDEVYQCLKLVSRPGCERIVRYAFEYARAHGRRKVSCMTKDNIMKLTDGLFHQVFDEIGEEYPEIKKDHWIIDIGMARAATRPEDFDVIVTPNLYGDILSDVTAEAAGSVGLAPSANIGDGLAMFEAIHGSAPGIAGKNVANPSGLLLASVMMLVHIGQADVAERVHNAWLRTIEDGYHTHDVYQLGISRMLVGTREFAYAVIERLGEEPKMLKPVRYGNASPMHLPVPQRREPARKDLVGIDVFVNWSTGVEDLAAKLQRAQTETLELQMITNRGVQVWPTGLPETFTTDHWRCRFMAPAEVQPKHQDLIALLNRIHAEEVDFIKTENLCLFDGKPGFSLGQGQ